MSTRVKMLLVCFTLLIAAAMCNAGEKPEVIRVGWTNFNLSQDWWISIQEFVFREAAIIEKEDNVKFEWEIRDGTQNPERQIKQMDDLMTMAEDFDIFLFNAVDEVGMGKAVEKFNRRFPDMPIGSPGNQSMSGKFLYVSLDNIRATKELGETFIELMTKKYGPPENWKNPGQEQGVIIEIWGPPSLSIVKERHIGFRQALDPILEKYPHLKVVEGLSNWRPDDAFKTCNDLVQRHRDDLIGIYSDCDIGATEGAWRAMEMAGIAFTNDDPRHIPLVAYDGTMNGLQAIRDGKIDATVNQPSPAYSHITFRMLYNWYKNGKDSLPKPGDVLDEEYLKKYFDLRGDVGAGQWAPVEVIEVKPGMIWYSPATSIIPRDAEPTSHTLWGNHIYKMEHGKWPDE